MAGEKDKKQIPLRLSASLYRDLAAWAEDDFRSINGQIEYLLTEAVRRRGRGKNLEFGQAGQGEENGQAGVADPEITPPGDTEVDE